MDTDGPLSGRTAIVTGSTGEGMGRQTALTLARHGADVALNHGTYRGPGDRVARLVKAIRNLGVRCEAFEADTRSQPEVEAMVEGVRDAFGKVDIAVANAGGDFVERAWDDVAIDEWRRVVQSELDGAYLLARHTIPDMRSRGEGRVVFISWEAATRAWRPPVDYAVGKMARDALAYKLARSEEAAGVTVNVVAPGYIPYPSEDDSIELAEHGKAWTGRQRATTQDVAECVLWLCTDAARFVTGSTIRVYGPSG